LFNNLLISIGLSFGSPPPSNIIISTQSMMMIPKTIRLNANLIALFKFANKNIILDDIYPTMSAFITEQEFKDFCKGFLFEQIKGDLKLGDAFCKKYNESNYVLSILPDDSAREHIRKFYVK
jgi:hypothetical protein